MKESEAHSSAYFNLFHEGGYSLRSTIEQQSPQMVPAVESLVKSGKLIGEAMFDETGEVDVLYHLNPDPSSTPIVVGPTPSPKGLVRNFHERK